MSVGIADGDDDDDDDKGYRNQHKVLNALEPSVDTEETIVVSIASDPIEDPEPACVALQIGMNLMMDDLNGEDEGGKVIPADSVTLFATIDGVELVYEGNVFDSEDCLTPNGYKSLDTLLAGFVKLGGEIKICPLCWNARGYAGSDPKFDAEVANAFDIHSLFLYADKVIAF